MKKGDKVKCTKTFYPNVGYYGPYPEVNKVYTIKEVCTVKGVLGLLLEELFDDMNLTPKGGYWYYQADCFVLLDGPSDGSGRTNDTQDKPNWSISKEVKEQRPFHMIP